MARAEIGKEAEMTKTIYTVVANIEQAETSAVSKHRSLAAAGRAYQAAHTGNMRRVIDAEGRDVTSAACDAANAQ